jgi:hypothetical protein
MTEDRKRKTILWDLEERWIENIDDNVRRILFIGSMVVLNQWVPKDPEDVCSVVTDGWRVTTTNSSLTPTVVRVSGDISMSSFLTHNK